MNQAQLQTVQEERRRRNRDRPRRRNAELPAGSPMYYYCHDCGEELVRPEGHREPAPRYCPDCRFLRAEGSR